jgi:hypothetical protein
MVITASKTHIIGGNPQKKLTIAPPIAASISVNVFAFVSMVFLLFFSPLSPAFIVRAVNAHPPHLPSAGPAAFPVLVKSEAHFIFHF